jgi:hypothetical protein
MEKENTTEEDLMKLYLESLNEKEHKAYLIAKSHLGMSFQLEKSNGYKKWKDKFVKNDK